MFTFKNNNNKIATEALDYLITNNIKPISCSNDREYDNETGQLVKEAENIYIKVEKEQEDIAISLMNEWISMEYELTN